MESIQVRAGDDSSLFGTQLTVRDRLDDVRKNPQVVAVTKGLYGNSP